jgi:PleD family two-component response regulator
LLLSQTTILDAKKIAKKIRIKIENSNSIVVIISLGITLFNENDTKNSFLKRVDKVLYQAKMLGKNRSVSFLKLFKQNLYTSSFPYGCCDIFIN